MRFRKFLRVTEFTRPLPQPRRETDLGLVKTQEATVYSLTRHDCSHLCGLQNHEKERLWPSECTSVSQALNSAPGRSLDNPSHIMGQGRAFSEVSVLKRKPQGKWVFAIHFHRIGSHE